MASFWTEVDGRPLPALLAGQPALELCNTIAGWDLPVSERGDYLTDFETLAVWSGHVGLLDDAEVARLRRRGRRHPEVAVRALTRTRWFRSDLHAAIVTADEASLTALVPWLRHASASLDVIVTDGRLRHVRAPAEPLERPLVATIAAAEQLLTGEKGPPRIGVCPGAGCGWLFLNPRGRRKWCSMAACGNRAKQAAHAARHR